MQPRNFLKNNFFSSSTPLGLDIGNFSVKIAQIRTSYFGKGGFLSFAVAPIKPDKSRDRIIEAIREVYKNMAVDSKKVNVSISGSNIILRYISLPLMREKDLAKSLEFELERYIPYKKENTVIDYRILAKLPNKKMLVLIVAGERQFIQERFDLVKDAGLEPQSINVDTLALSEAFKVLSPHPKGVVALLDIGYRLSKLAVLENDIPIFSRDIKTGESNIIQVISEKMNVDLNKARELGHNPEDNISEITKIITPDLNSLLDELLLSFEYCERNLEKRVERLYLTGGGSRIKILLESIKKIPNLEVELLDPTQGFKVSSSVTAEEIRECVPFLAVAIGLALS